MARKTRNRSALLRLPRKIARPVANQNGRRPPRNVSSRPFETLAAALPFWQNLELISSCQKAIWGNLMPPWWDAWHEFVRLAPARLSQSILPWSFSAFQFTNEIQGDPEIEYKILTRVAGYGSQLGTIMDFLQVLAERIRPDIRSQQSDVDRYKVLKFYHLLQKIDGVKGQAAD